MTGTKLNSMRIGTKEIGVGYPVFVIAEAGVNHNGDVALAKQLIDIAFSAAADAVKFQTFTPEELVSESAPQAAYQSVNTGREEAQGSMLARLVLSHKEHSELKKYAEDRGIMFLSTPFSTPDADFLDSLDISAIKIPSGEITNIPFLRHVAKMGRPIIVSTGMATLAEVRDAYDVLKGSGAHEIAILQCTTEYPTPLEHANLRVIETFLHEFPVPIGYSDHTLGIEASIYAVALGASIIEKHFTLDRSFEGPDHRASLEPQELREMISKIRTTTTGTIDIPERALGSSEKRPNDIEKENARVIRKSIIATVDIAEGTLLSEQNIGIKRPASGLPPGEWDDVVGKKATRSITKGTPLQHDMLA